jgi:hypothetical protein
MIARADDSGPVTNGEAFEQRPVELFEIVISLLLAQVAILLAYALPDLLNRLS